MLINLTGTPLVFPNGSILPVSGQVYVLYEGTTPIRSVAFEGQLVSATEDAEDDNFNVVGFYPESFHPEDILVVSSEVARAWRAKGEVLNFAGVYAPVGCPGDKRVIGFKGYPTLLRWDRKIQLMDLGATPEEALDPVLVPSKDSLACPWCGALVCWTCVSKEGSAHCSRSTRASTHSGHPQAGDGSCDWYGIVRRADRCDAPYISKTLAKKRS